MALGSATTSTLTNLAAATAWRPFRTIDATNPRAHYYPWLRRLRPATQRRVVKRWVDTTQAAWLPGQARDSYRRRLLSADYIGPEKCSQGWEFCARCRVACGGLAACTPAQHEDVLHACELCPAPGGAAEIMLIVTQCWEATTGELLKPTGPTALFGDRRYGRLEEDVHAHAHLQQPWQALHAAVVVALDAARRASRPAAFTSRKLHTKPLDEAAQPRQ